MKVFAIYLSLLLFTWGSLAQTDSQAKQLLDEVSAKVKSYDNIVLSFKHEVKNTGRNVSNETRGEVHLQNDKYLMDLMGAQRLYDGQRLYTIIPEDREVVISKPGEDEGELTPSEMLTFYEEGYTYKWDIEQNVMGRRIQFIELKPTDDSEVKQILLGIDTRTKHIYRLIQVMDDGTMITTTVQSFKTNQTLPATLFIFDEDKYRDYYLNYLD